jgi:hypothetical protein
LNVAFNSAGMDFNASDTDECTYREPRMKIYVLATLVGTIAAILFAGVIFDTSSIAVAASMGTVLACLGALMGENIGEAIVLSVILGVMCVLLLWVAPDPVASWAGTWAVPAVIGFASGKIVVGIWREVDG